MNALVLQAWNCSLIPCGHHFL